MSSRPRLGGEGRLRLPDDVAVGLEGAVNGVFGIRDYDPFARTDEDLLLAESFARFDFRRPPEAQDWFVAHGVIDIAWLFPDVYVYEHQTAFADRSGDLLEDVEEQQRSVRWHLQALARLSAEGARAGPRRSDRQAHEGWDPRWAEVALRSPHGAVVWIGQTMDFDGQIPLLMQRHARHQDVPAEELKGFRAEYNGVHFEIATKTWWPQAHAAWQRIQREGIPVLWVPRRAMYERWPWDEAPLDPHRELSELRGLGTDWHGLMELERRLLRPYVQRAALHELDIVSRRRGEPPDADEPDGHRWYGTLEVIEARRWRSVLAPVYLQLFEALRRISEGRQGGAFCRECGEPFLILDARRSAFCNDRERSRWFQRQRRRRLGAAPREGGDQP